MCRVFPALPHRFGPAHAWYWHPHRGRCAVSRGKVAHGRRPHHRGNRPAEIVLLGGKHHESRCLEKPQVFERSAAEAVRLRQGRIGISGIRTVPACSAYFPEKGHGRFGCALFASLSPVAKKMN